MAEQQRTLFKRITKLFFHPNCLLALCWFALVYPWLIGKRTVPWDSKEFYFPLSAFNVQSWRAGELPFWNPYQFTGFPSIADPQGMVFSPLLTLLMLLESTPTLRWFDTIVFLHLLLGGYGILALGRYYGLHPYAALLAALVFMFGGSAAARLQHTLQILGYCFIPWAFYFLVQLLQQRLWRHAVALGLLGGVMLLHPTQITYLAGVLLAAYAFYRLIFPVTEVSKINRLNESTKQLAQIVFAGLIAVTIALPHLYAVYSFLPLTNRPSFSFDSATFLSMLSIGYVTLLIPNFFGNLKGVYWGYGDLTESYLYVGIVPVLLLLWAWARYKGPQQNYDARFFLFAALAYALYTAGKYTPLYSLLYQALPGVSLFRRPSDGTYIFNFALAMLTAFAAHKFFSQHEVVTIRSIRLAAIAGLCGCFLIWVLQHVQTPWWGVPDFPEGQWRITLKYCAYAILACSLAAIVLRYAQAKLGLALLLMLVLLDFRQHNIGSQFNNIQPSSYSLVNIKEPNPVVHFLREKVNESNTLPWRFEATMTDMSWDNAASLLRVPSTQGVNPLQHALYSKIVGGDYTFYQPRSFTLALPSYSSPIFNLLGVRYIVSSAQDLKAIDPQLDPNQFPLVLEGSGLRVWENRQVLPRLLNPVRQREIEVTNPDLVAIMHTMDYRNEILIHSDGITVPSCMGKVSFQPVYYRNTEIEIDLQADKPAWLVLTDLYHPWWKAEIDGQPITLFQANGMFRAVCVPAGSHKLRMQFNPFS